jgi:hypothetical protein
VKVVGFATVVELFFLMLRLIVVPVVVGLWVSTRLWVMCHFAVRHLRYSRRDVILGGGIGVLKPGVELGDVYIGICVKEGENRNGTET